jgi:hypothetical protein
MANQSFGKKPRIQLATVSKVLWVAVGLLTVSGLVVVFLAVRLGSEFPSSVEALFNLDKEQTIATWFSSMLLGVNGFLSLALRSTEQELRLLKYWTTLGWLLLVLSLDEAASLHERTGLLLANLRLEGAFEYAWVIPGTVAVLLAGVWFLGLFRHLEPRLRNLLMAAGFLYVAGALGVEFLEGAVASGALFGAVGEKGTAYNSVVAIQELMEMAGLVILLMAFLRELRTRTEQRGLIVELR